MPKLLNGLPALRKHSTGQAYCELGGRRFYFGAYGTPAARAAFDSFVARWIAAGRPSRMDSAEELTISHLALEYWRACKASLSDGELHPTQSALRILRRLYGPEPAAEFGPKKLKSVRDAMIAEGWARKSINRQIARLRRVFKWGASEELVSAEIWHALAAVEGLRAGRSQAREPEPIGPVSDDVVEATLPHLPAMVADMVRVQRLLGCRPAEVCCLRAADIDRSGEVWEFRPPRHKNAWRGKSRVILVGPQAQRILNPYLARRPEGYLFAPEASEKDRRREAHQRRRTPLHHGNGPARNRKRTPKTKPGEQYLVAAYRRAITRACE